MIEDFFDLIVSNLFENINHQQVLEKLIKGSKTIRIVCPFISVYGAKWLVEKKPNDCVLEIITELSPRGVATGVQSPEALRFLISSGASVAYLQSGLHAKVYWIDGTKVIVSSANLTRNGLNNNFEVGVCLDSSTANELRRRKKSAPLSECVRDLWDFVKRSSKPLMNDDLVAFDELARSTEKMRDAIATLASDFEEVTVGPSFERFQRPCLNSQNMLTDLKSTKMFQGFRAENWDVFQHSMELNESNLTLFRHQLDKAVDPILRRFYQQLRMEPIFKTSLGSLDVGGSKQVQLRRHFPHDRYLFLTKSQTGKRPNKHLGEPSFIVGMGLNQDGPWLEVRSGVEEDRLNALSPAGTDLLANMRSDLEAVVGYLNSMEQGWRLTHGSYSQELQESIDVKSLTKNTLLEIIDHYLRTKELSDLQVRRKYFVKNDGDREMLFSPNVTATVARDFEKLKYIFDLAHRK